MKLRFEKKTQYGVVIFSRCELYFHHVRLGFLYTLRGKKNYRFSVELCSIVECNCFDTICSKNYLSFSSNLFFSEQCFNNGIFLRKGIQKEEKPDLKRMMI